MWINEWHHHINKQGYIHCLQSPRESQINSATHVPSQQRSPSHPHSINIFQLME